MEKMKAVTVGRVLALVAVAVLGGPWNGARSAHAGVVLMTDKATSEEADSNTGPRGETYPESRFGQTPQVVDVGVGRSYAAKATQEIDTDDENGNRPRFGEPAFARRMPAGLQFGGGANTGAPTTAVPRMVPMDGDFDAGASSARSAPVKQATIVRRGVQEVGVIASDLGFFPKTLFVTRDIPVRMFVTGSSKNALCIMMDSFGVKRQIRSSRIEEISFIPSTPGRYRFYCPVNGMEGTMVVKELAAVSE